MSVKKWLNDHNLLLSSLAVSVVVVFLNVFQVSLYNSLRLPYLRLEYALQDWIYNMGKLAPKDDRIVFLYDDAASHTLTHLWDDEFDAAPILKKMKQPKWPREVYAAILNRLGEAGARVVGFDYVFQGEQESDGILKEALDRYKGRVVIGSQLDDAKAAGTTKFSLNPPPESLVPSIEDPRLGFVNIFPDEDGVVRRFKFETTLLETAHREALSSDTRYESLPARMLSTAGLGGNIVKAGHSQRLRFAYKGETMLEMTRPDSVANIFVQSVWESNYQNGEAFRDKIVLVGPTGNLHKDTAESPFGLIGGPEFHLNVMHALLSHSFLHESDRVIDGLLISAGGLLAFGAGALLRNPLLRISLLLVLSVAFVGAALWVFNHNNLVVPVLSPLVSLLGSGATFIVWQQIVERAEKAKMRRTFERYVSRDVVKELLDNPQSYLNTVVGVRKKVSVLFSDVRGFTTITESGDVQALVAQLNEYFDHMVNIVFANRGTLDKFIGDAVMAQWGGITSLGEKEDAIGAVRTAIQMRKRLAELNQKWIPEGKLSLKFGIGINHGEAIVGNLGCEAKSEISLIGDAVNTASRFEGMTKEFHVDLLVGETVEKLVRDEFIIRTVALSLPQGKTKPVGIFTIIDEKAAGAPTWLSVYEEGIRLYRNREFAQAKACMEKALSEVPDDWLCRYYRDTNDDLQQNPPDEDWEPIYVMKKK